MLPQEDTVNDVFLELNEPQKPNPGKFVRFMLFLAGLVTSEKQMEEAETRIKNRKVMFPWFFGTLTLIQIFVFIRYNVLFKERYVCFQNKFTNEYLLNLNYFTYTFVHHDIISLSQVILKQLCFGIPLEAAFGSEYIGFAFICSAVTQKIIITYTFRYVVFCGAGSVNTVIFFTHLSNFSLNRKTMNYRLLQSRMLFIVLILDVIYYTKRILNIEVDLVALLCVNIYCSMLGCFFGSFMLNKNTADEKWTKSWKIAIVVFIVTTFAFLCFLDS